MDSQGPFYPSSRELAKINFRNAVAHAKSWEAAAMDRMKTDRQARELLIEDWLWVREEADKL